MMGGLGSSQHADACLVDDSALELLFLFRRSKIWDLSKAPCFLDMCIMEIADMPVAVVLVVAAGKASMSILTISGDDPFCKAR